MKTPLKSRYRFTHLLLYYLTIHILLTTTNNFLRILSKVAGKQVYNQYNVYAKRIRLLGYLPDGSKLIYPLDELKLVTIINEIYFQGVYNGGSNLHGYILDVGAHIGTFTLRVLKRCNYLRKVIAIEANPENVRFLTLNMLLNKAVEKVTIIPYAVLDREKFVKIFHSITSRGDSSIASNWHKIDEGNFSVVYATTLDRILQNLPSVSLLKMDIEGSEFLALKGLEKSHNKIQRIKVEIHEPLVNKESVFAWLLNHDYEVILIRRLYKDTVLVHATKTTVQ
jgi:FkbM family methyltransferase